MKKFPHLFSQIIAVLIVFSIACPVYGADSVNWYKTELSLGILNCTISNSELSQIRVQSVALDRKSAVLRVGQATRLVPTITPYHAANQTVTWKSSNKKIAKVSKNGWVTAKKKGTCRITAYTADGKKKAVCKITVKAASGSGVKPIELAKTKLTLYTGQAKVLAVKLKTPLGSSPVIWKSSRTSVATVDQSGRITALRQGTTTISARSRKTGKTAKCRVTVKGKYGITRSPWQIRRASTSTTYSAQGSGVDNGTYFKLWNYNTVQLYEFSSGALKSEFKLDARHGNLIDFDTASGTDGGPYHDAYVTAETNPAMVNVYRFSDTGAERLRSYVFPLAQTGYNAGHVLDPANRLLYMVGYTRDSFYNPANNEMIVSVWSLDGATELMEGFYRPRFVKSFRLPFILTLQGQCLHEGKLYIMSSHWVNPRTMIYVVNLSTQSVESTITYLPTELKHQEMESIFFVGNALYIDKNSYLYRLTS